VDRAERIERVCNGPRLWLNLGWAIWHWAIEISSVKSKGAKTRVNSPYSGVEVHTEERILNVTELARLIIAVL